MLMMGLELMLNGVLLAVIGFWSFGLGGAPEGQLLALVVMAVMAVEMAIGFALVVAVYRKRQADITERLTKAEGASCRGRVWQSVLISVDGCFIKQKKSS